MRIVIDLQGAQTGSQGRIDYLLAFVLALVRNTEDHEIWLVLNATFPERILQIRKAFENLIPFERIQICELFSDQVQVADKIREYFIQNLQPDMVLVTHLEALTSFYIGINTAVILPDDLLFNSLVGDTKFHYINKLQSLKNAGLLLVTSDSVRRDIIDLLSFPSENVTNIFNAATPIPLPSMDLLAKTALQAIENYHAKSIRKKTHLLNQFNAKKPRLAFVSPFPPEQTGIAIYSAELLPELSRYFDIELITDQSVDEPFFASIRLLKRSIRWFEQNGAFYDRILYHVGNSFFHGHMVDLLKQHPGVVVLHDFFLGHMIAYEEVCRQRVGFWLKALLNSHGYCATQSYLNIDTKQGREQVMNLYPCNWEILQYAKGVIVHSAHAQQLAQQWYGEGVGKDWGVIPLLCNTNILLDRFAAREALGISQDAFVVCSFGFINPAKLSHYLLEAWQSSQLHTKPQCELIFVGESQGDYGANLSEVILSQGDGSRIRITGWCDEALYQQYLQAADVGVQLRSWSRGETSKAVLDGMNYGLALIVNANGSMAELPSHAVWMLPDEFTVAELVVALETLWQNTTRRTELAQYAREYILTKHQPQTCAVLYQQTIESIYQNTAADAYELMKEIAISKSSFSADELQWMAQSIAASFRPRLLQRQLLVDVTSISRHDLKGGIERVVRAQLLELLKNPPVGFRIEPVYLSHHEGKWHYRYARAYTLRLLEIPARNLEDAPIDIYAGDIFYSPDYAPDAMTAAAKLGLYLKWRALGVQINMLIHDLLPISQPQFFVEGSGEIHARWLLEMVKYADRLIGVSFSVAQEIYDWLDQQSCLPSHPLKITAVTHGADMIASAPSLGMPKQATKILKQLEKSMSFLMVGTIEPRKGHLQVLEAFEILWKENCDVTLVIVGKEGWKSVPEDKRRTIPTIINKLKKHLKQGKQLFWLEGTSDEYLEKIYATTTCLLVASEGEGFGLPLIEAARAQLPILARDLPVFREVAQENAYYFKGLSAQDLASSLRAWIKAYTQNKIPIPTGISCRTWSENVDALKTVLLGQNATEYLSSSQSVNESCQV